MTKRSAVGYVFTKNLTKYTLLNANDSLNFFYINFLINGNPQIKSS